MSIKDTRDQSEQLERLDQLSQPEQPLTSQLELPVNSNSSAPRHYQLIILGSGPAGCSAAIYAGRANLQCALLSGMELGGQLTKAQKIANWPGSAEITGASLMGQMLEQLQQLPVELLYDSALRVDLSTRPFRIYSQAQIYSCDALIIAMGSNPRLLQLANEATYLGHGVSTCATCDGFFYQEQEVAIVGGGNSMLHAAFYLAKMAKKVHIIHHSATFRAEALALAKLQQLPNVVFHRFREVVEYLGDGRQLTGVKLRVVTNGLESVPIKSISSCEDLAVSALFLQIGALPNTALFNHQLQLDAAGHLILGFNAMRTQCSVDGVFGAGDLVHQLPKQAIVAAGWGCMAAMDAISFLQHHS